MKNKLYVAGRRPLCFSPFIRPQISIGLGSDEKISDAETRDWSARGPRGKNHGLAEKSAKGRGSVTNETKHITEL